jgi:Protein of unknown function (DUF3592)
MAERDCPEEQSAVVDVKTLKAARRIVAAFFLVGIPLIFGGATVYHYNRETALRDHGQIATATVIEIEGNARVGIYTVVRFTTADGREVSARLVRSSPYRGPAVGETATVRYAPANPSHEFLFGSRHYIQYAPDRPDLKGVWVMVTVAGLYGIGSIIITGYFIKRRASAGA